MVRLSVHVVHLVALVVDEAHCITKWCLCNTYSMLCSTVTVIHIYRLLTVQAMMCFQPRDIDYIELSCLMRGEISGLLGD